MKIRMKIQIVGTRDGVAWPPVGGEKDVPDHEGARLCANGFAEPVVEEKSEKAVPKDSAEKRTPAKKSAAKKS